VSTRTAPDFLSFQGFQSALWALQPASESERYALNSRVVALSVARSFRARRLNPRERRQSVVDTEKLGCVVLECLDTPVSGTSISRLMLVPRKAERCKLL
jgi:hypothetical protein